jgi:hypothetical protein
MFRSLYRFAARPHLAHPPGRVQGEEAVLVATFAVFWLVSLVRVVGALVRHEVFAGESTLALIVLFAVPWLLVTRRRKH